MRVHRTTARCDICPAVYVGELMAGRICPNCETGHLYNIALIASDETPRPFTEDEAARA